MYELITPSDRWRISECESDGESVGAHEFPITKRKFLGQFIASVPMARRSYSFDKGESTIARVQEVESTGTTENNLRTDFVESFARYYHPDTDQLVETGHVYFEDDYDGEYSVIRLATSSGGSVICHPEQHVRVGANTSSPRSGPAQARPDRHELRRRGSWRHVSSRGIRRRLQIEAFFKDGSDVRVQSQFNALLESIGNHLSGDPSGEATCIGACD